MRQKGAIAARGPRPTWGSRVPIDHGACTRTLHRRAYYGGRKGRAANGRLRALERRIARGFGNPWIDGLRSWFAQQLQPGPIVWFR